MSKCKSFAELDRMARWLSDLDNLIEEMEQAEQTVLSSHLESVAADLEFQTQEFVHTREAQVIRNRSHLTGLDNLIRESEEDERAARRRGE